MTTVQMIKGGVSTCQRMLSQKGYLLPITIALGLGIGTVSVLGLQVVGQNSATLNNQYYTSVAKEAAQSGIAAAAQCILSNNTAWSTNNRSLTPATDCTGTLVTNKSATLTNNSTLQTTYSVGQLQSVGASATVVTSVGTVSIKGPFGVIVKSFTSTTRTYANTSQPVTNRVSKPVDQMSVGDDTACAVAKGWVYCWGDNTNNLLGSGKVLAGNMSDSPIAVDSSSGNPMTGKTATKVSVGTTHACAIANGNAYCWGDNTYGQLGNRTNTASGVPVAVDTTNSALTGKTVVEISAGNGFTCALTSDGKVSCWGLNNQGQLGYGDSVNTNYPINTSNPNSRAVHFDAVVSCRVVVIITVCTVVTPARDFTAPPSILANKNVTKLARVNGAATMCAIDDTGKSYCWGNDSNGQVGDTPNSTSGTVSDTGNCAGGATSYPPAPPVPSTAANFPDVYQPTATQISYPTDAIFTFGSRTILKTSSASTTTPNRMYSWSDYSTSTSVTKTRRICGGGNGGPGVNKYEGTTTLHYTVRTTISSTPLYNDPSGTTLNLKQLSLASGNAYSGLFCALTGVDLYCDANGGSNLGQTGSNYPLTGALPTEPQRVYMDGWLLGKTILDVQVGTAFACVLTDQGVGCWGYNNKGQVGDNSVTNRNVPVAVDIGLTSDLGEDVTISSGAMFANPINF